MARANQRADKREINRQLGDSHGSYELVVSPVILGLLGWWIDGRAGTGPWFLIVFAVFGVTGAVTKIYLEYRRRMDVVAAEARAASESRAERHTADRAAREAERAALQADLEAQLAEVEARDTEVAV